MANFSVKASFDGSELVQGFKEVKTEINGLTNAGKSAQKSLGEMLQKKNSTSDYRRQLSLLSREITDLTVNYRRMSEAEQQSEFGVALKQRIDELTAKASEFKDAMLDVQQSINESASDTANWDAFQSLIDITASSLQTFAGVAGLSEDSTAALNKTIGIMMTTGAAANTVIKVGNALQKTSALMLGVARVQNAAAAAAITIKTAAEGKSIVVTKAATVAQKAFNIVAKANPYVLLATVILGVGVALAGFIKQTKNAEKEQEDYNKRIEEQKEKEHARKDAVNTSVGEIIGKYKLLQYHWKQLSSEQEKNRWISENQSAFNDLGIAINDVNTAQRVFVENSELVVKALKDQARAKAMAQLYEEAIVAQYKADKKLQDEQKVAKQKYPEGYRPSSDEVEAARLNDSDYLTVWAENSLWDQKVNDKPRGEMKPTDAVDYSGATKLQNNYVKEHKQAAEQAAADVAQIEQAYTDAQKEAAASAAALKGAGIKYTPGGSGKGGSSTTQQEDIFADDSLRAAQQEVQKLQDKLNRMSPNDAAFETTKKQLIEAQAKVKALQDKMKAPDAVINPNSLKGLQQEVSTLQNKLNSLSPDDEAFNTTLQQLNEAKAKVKELQDKMREPVTPLTKTEQLIKTYEDAGKQISDIAKQHEIGLIDVETAKKQIDKINAELIKLGLNPIKVQLEVQTDKVMDAYSEIRKKIDDTLQKYDIGAIGPKQAQGLINSFNAELEAIGLKPIQVNINTERAIQAIDGLAAHFEMLNTVGQAVSSINSVYDAFKNLPDAMDEAENGWERFMVGFETGMTILNAITSIFSMINGLIMTFNTIQQISTLLKKKDAAASGEQAIADMAAAETSMTKGGAQMFEAATGAGKSLSWLPIVGPILAIAAIGAIMGVMMGVMNKSKFATGGIVPGNRIGDMDLVRVNGGEMILNNRQQSNLFRMLDQNRFQTPDLNPKTVNFRIQGDTLVGVIENYNRKKSRS